MGIETAIAAGTIGSSVLGAGLQYGEQRAARKRQQGIDDQISNRLNSGQDSFLQMLRSDPTALKPFQFDASQAFQQLQAQDKIDAGDQINQLRAGAGSLGARFGTGFASREALLRGRIDAATGARNAGIAQSSFNNALNLGSADYNASQQRQLGLLQLLQGGANAGAQLPSTGALVGQTGGDIGSLLTLFQYLNKNGGGASGAVRPPTPTVLPSTVSYYPYE